MLKKVDKIWGFEEWWINEPEYCFKILVMKPGFVSSRHYHLKKKETFLVLKGKCYLRLWEERVSTLVVHSLVSEMSVTIYPGQHHQFYTLAKEGPCVVYEISTHHDEADVVRLSESGPM